MKESYLAECLGKFHELPEQLQEMVGGFEACLKIKKIEEAYNVSLSFATILIAISELTIDDLADYLYLKFGINKSKGEEIADHLEEEVFAPAFELIIENLAEETSEEASENEVKNSFGPLVNLSLTDKKELILKTFTSEIVPALQAKPARLQDFNVAIFQVFNTDENLEDRVESLLYNNQEKLSDHHIILDGHPASPSIANWLKDFIKKYGSDIFNEVALAEYLSQSPNVKQLKPTEKDLVRKVLKLYRNLVFFPESMDGIPLEHWEVFPVDRARSDSIRDVLSDNKSTGAILDETPVISENKVESPDLDLSDEPVLTDRQKIIFDLQKSLTRYPANSLEYKAIHQEINRLSRK